MVQREPEIPGNLVLRILSSGLLPAESVARVQALLSASGFTPEALGSQRSRIPVRWLEPLVALSGGLSPRLAALRTGEQARLTSHGRLGLLVMTAATLREALSTVGFLPLLSNAATLDFVEGHDEARLYLRPRTGSALIDEMIVYYAAAAMLHLHELLTGQEPRAVMHIQGPQPPEFETHPRFRPEQWRFEAAAHCFVLARKQLDLPILFADPVAHELTRRQCEQELAALQESGLLHKVKKLLEESRGYPEQEDIARHLNMSSSTLKRRLAEEGSNFNELLRGIKCDHAVRLLTTTPLSCQEIADQLGFSSQTNFTHAFKKWTGLTPTAFRNRG